MNVDDYQKETKKSARKVDESFPQELSIAILCMGLAGESGEVVDLLKKHLGHGHDLDKTKLTKELGDVTWYVSEIANAFGIKLSDILQVNIDKLRKRYPDGFSEEASKNRKE